MRRLEGALLRIATFGVFGLGVATVGTVLWLVVWRHGIAGAGRTLADEAVIGLSTLTLVVVVSTASGVFRQAVRRRHVERRDSDQRDWSARWIDVVFGDVEPPPPPLGPGATEALLDLKESLGGEAAESINEIISRYGIDADLISRVEHANPFDVDLSEPKMGTTPRPRRRRLRQPAGLERHLEQLDELARMRSPTAVPALIVATKNPEPVAKLMAVRALVRCASAISTDVERRSVARQIARTLHDAGLSGGVLAEALELLGPTAPFVVGHVLRHQHRYGVRFVVAALDAIGNGGLTELAGEITPFIVHRRVNVRSAAIRALSELGTLTPEVASAVRAALDDPNEGVRLEATRTARLFEPSRAVELLEAKLADRSWAVRRAAAASLSSLGKLGTHCLIRAALEHTDRHARTTATQLLIENRSPGELNAERRNAG